MNLSKKHFLLSINVTLLLSINVTLLVGVFRWDCYEFKSKLFLFGFFFFQNHKRLSQKLPNQEAFVCAHFNAFFHIELKGSN